MRAAGSICTTLKPCAIASSGVSPLSIPARDAGVVDASDRTRVTERRADVPALRLIVRAFGSWTSVFSDDVVATGYPFSNRYM